MFTPSASDSRADFLALPHLFHYPIRGFLSADFSMSEYGAPLRMRCRLVPRNTVDTAHCVRHYASGERLGISAQRSSGAALETSVGMGNIRPDYADATAFVLCLQARIVAGAFFRQGRARLQEGAWIVMFPEGTRTRVGAQGPYKTGGARFAVQAGVPVIPIAHNAGYVWPRNSFTKYPGTVTVSIGPAIPTASLSPQQVNARVEEWIEMEMRRIDAGAD